MNPEKRQIIHDLLDGNADTRRAATLAAGGLLLRRRRRRRQLLQGMTVIFGMALVLAGARSLWFGMIAGQLVVAVNPSVQKAGNDEANEPASSLQSLTDAQLLALFPDTPVALVTLRDGEQRLVFPRPGDQERIVMAPGSTAESLEDIRGEVGLGL